MVNICSNSQAASKHRNSMIILVTLFIIIMSNNNLVNAAVDEIPTLLDNATFSWLNTSSWRAIWIVFSLIFGTINAGIMYKSLDWLIDILSVWAIPS